MIMSIINIILAAFLCGRLHHVNLQGVCVRNNHKDEVRVVLPEAGSFFVDPEDKVLGCNPERRYFGNHPGCVPKINQCPEPQYSFLDPEDKVLGCYPDRRYFGKK